MITSYLEYFLEEWATTLVLGFIVAWALNDRAIIAYVILGAILGKAWRNWK